MEFYKQGKYSCNYCMREYKEKYNYDRHIGFCEFSHKSAKERETEIEAFDKIPTVNELFHYIKEISVRVDKLEKENTHLKQLLNIENKKLNIIDQLNYSTNKPPITFTQWIKDLDYGKYIYNIFDADLMSGMFECCCRGSHGIDIYNKENSPIRCFTQKPNVFFVYDEINCGDGKILQWTMLNGKSLDKWLNYIAHAFLVQFKFWCDENQTEIDNDEAKKEQYFNNYKKVLGSTKQTDEIRNLRIRQKLYSIMKTDFSKTGI